MDWIKINTTLPREPKVMRLAAMLGCSRLEALGVAVEWLCWLDGISADGCTGMSAELVNSLFAQPRLVDALCAIGWAHIDDSACVVAANYSTHNGESAKKRTLAAEKKRKQREKAALSPKNGDNCPPKMGTAVSSERGLDKIREYNTETTTQSYNTVVSEKTPCAGLSEPPNDPKTVENFLANQAVCGLRGSELTACAEAFFNDCEAVGWTQKGQPIRNWQAAARAFLTRWQQNKSPKAAAAPVYTFRSSQKQNYDL